jgi:cytochrome c peroxidase
MSRSRKGFLPILAGRSRTGVCRVFLCAALALPGVRLDTPTPDTPTEDEPITPVVVVDDLDPAKVELGRKLFEDPRVSGGNTVSCASCHDLDRSGDDQNRRSLSSDGRLLDFNAPTIFNAALNFRLNWRGNFRTLEAQNESVLLGPRLMNIGWDELLKRLRADRDYQSAFSATYAGGAQRSSVLDALATFQRSLLTPDAPFDDYLRGAPDAITTDQQRGYQLFKSYGCIACHQGRNLGGNLLQKFGIFADPFSGRAMTEADLGRYSITHLESDRQVFRVPSLRNVAVTAPYFHDGHVSSLIEAVDTMARSQLGRELPKQDLDLIVGFLSTLTGKYQGRSLAASADRNTK